MSSGAAIRRQDAVLKMAAVSALLALLVVTLDAVRFHAVPLVAGEHVALDAHTMMLLGLLAIEAPVLWGIARCLRRQLQLQRRLRGVESVGREAIAGAVVQIVRGRRPVAFCAGLLRPRIYVTEAALEQLDAAQLRAVVAHELGHARRRDPLRMAVADVVAGGFWFIAPLRRVAVRQASVADLAADAAALRTAGGSPQALASALLALGYADPERIEQLVGRPPRAAPCTAPGRRRARGGGARARRARTDARARGPGAAGRARAAPPCSCRRSAVGFRRGRNLSDDGHGARRGPRQPACGPPRGRRSRW
jgi:Zn-dependent protease with chaperone function